ncbi:MAG: hypothetical protein IT260_24135, partial [Saprospiraceae bacterium]|nr:hypothetical protein [Saprospiraceae bacterium]
MKSSKRKRSASSDLSAGEPEIRTDQPAAPVQFKVSSENNATAQFKKDKKQIEGSEPSGPELSAEGLGTRQIQRAPDPDQAGLNTTNSFKVSADRASTPAGTIQRDAAKDTQADLKTIDIAKIAAAEVGDMAWYEQLKNESPNGLTVALLANYDYGDAKTKANNAAFFLESERFARLLKAVSVEGGKIVVGKPVKVDTVTDGIKAIQGIVKGMIEAYKKKNPDKTIDDKDLPPWLKINNLAIFAHGEPFGLGLNKTNDFRTGTLTNDSTTDFVKGLKGAVSNDVRFQLFSCNTAIGKDEKPNWNVIDDERKGKGSFAENLVKASNKELGTDASAYAHATAAHTSENTAAWVFGKDAGAGEGGRHLFSLIFNEAFAQDEMNRLYPLTAAKTGKEYTTQYTKLRREMKDVFFFWIFDKNSPFKMKIKSPSGKEVEVQAYNIRTYKTDEMPRGEELFYDFEKAKVKLRKAWFDNNKTPKETSTAAPITVSETDKAYNDALTKARSAGSENEKNLQWQDAARQLNGLMREHIEYRLMRLPDEEVAAIFKGAQNNGNGPNAQGYTVTKLYADKAGIKLDATPAPTIQKQPLQKKIQRKTSSNLIQRDEPQTGTAAGAGADAGTAAGNAALLQSWETTLPKANAKDAVTSETHTKIAALIEKNRMAIADHAAKLASVKGGYMYLGTNPGLPSNLQETDKDKTGRIEYKASQIVWKEVGSEGGTSSINTYDDQVVTWGKGFSGAAGSMQEALGNLFAADAGIKSMFRAAGVALNGRDWVVVDTASAKIATQGAALKIIQQDKRLLSLLIEVAENDQYKQKALDAQWKTITAHAGKVPDYVFDKAGNKYADEWSDGAVAFAAHMSHWLPGYGWEYQKQGFKDTKGNVLKMVLQVGKKMGSPLANTATFISQTPYNPLGAEHFGVFGKGGSAQGNGLTALKDNSTLLATGRAAIELEPGLANHQIWGISAGQYYVCPKLSKEQADAIAEIKTADKYEPYYDNVQAKAMPDLLTTLATYSAGTINDLKEKYSGSKGPRLLLAMRAAAAVKLKAKPAKAEKK